MDLRTPSAALFPLLAALAACSQEPPPSLSPPPPPGATTLPAAVSGACVARDEPDAGEPPDGYDVERAAVEKPEAPGDTCAVADSNLQRAASAILAAARLPPGAAPVGPSRWDHRRRPLRLDDVARRFALGGAEMAALQKNGFVVPARLEVPGYATGLHEIYQSELPLFVSADAILHAVYVGNDTILARLEERRLAPLLRRTLAVMHCALPGVAAAYPAETARDLDVYLTVARSLLADRLVAPVDNESTGPAGTLVAQARAAAGTGQVDLFGRARPVDFTAFTPRGHHADGKRLAPYFRAATWLAQVDAPALADLAARAGVSEGLRALDQARATFGGKRGDLSFDMLVAPRTAGRLAIGAADLGYALGHDRAGAYLGDEEAHFPRLGARLDEARALARAPQGGEDLRGLWLRAVLGLAERPAGALPSFMAGEAFADLRLDSAITAFAQRRADAAPPAGQAYEESGCAIPDGYVEPAPAVYQALLAYAERGAAAVAAVDPGDDAFARGYFTSLAGTLRVLDAIAADELAGRPLTADQIGWLSMVLETTPGSSSGGPTYTGWYFDLFPARLDALGRADFSAGPFTSGPFATVTQVGATAPRLGIFVVDTGGAPRVVVGPVARGYEHRGPRGEHLDDEAASAPNGATDPWAAGYTVPAPPVPELSLSYQEGEATLTAPRPLGSVTVEALDHHRRLVEAVSHYCGAGETRFVFRKTTEERSIEAIHLQAGAFNAWSSTWQGGTLDITTGKGADAP